MQTLELKGTDETPNVMLNAQEGNLEFSGRALVDNPGAFFKPVLEWLNEYIKAPRSNTRVSFKLDYLNNGASKAILDILTILEKAHGTRVLWYFKDEDEDMEEAGEELAELVKIPFEFIAY